MFPFQEMLWPIVILGGLGLIFCLGLAFASKSPRWPGTPRSTKCASCCPARTAAAAGILAATAAPRPSPRGGVGIRLPGGRRGLGRQDRRGHGRSGRVRRAPGGLRSVPGGENCHDKMRYQGLSLLRGGDAAPGGPKACSFGCMGLGDCVKACPFGAITINQAGVARVDPDKCQSCGKCLGIPAPSASSAWCPSRVRR